MRLVNVAIFAVTAVAVVLILAAGRTTESPPPELAVGQPAPETFIANRSTDPIEDVEETQAARDDARANVPTVYSDDSDATFTVIRNVNSFFIDLREGAHDELMRRPLEEQIEILELRHSTLLAPIPSLVALYNSDLDRVERGEEAVFPEVEQQSLELLGDELGRGIRPGDLAERQAFYLSALTRPPLFVIGLPDEEQTVAREAITQLVGFSLQANLRVDNDATTAAKNAAAEAVDPVYITYHLGDTIVEVGKPISFVQFRAITELELYEPSSSGGIGWLVVIVGLSAVVLFLAWPRLVGERWSHPRNLVPLAAVVLLSAVIARVLLTIGL